MRTFNILAAALAACLAPIGALAQQPAPEVRHDLSEICAGDSCQWERYAQCDGFIEGINFDADGTLWMLAYFKGEVLKVEDGACVTVGDAAGAPNGAKIAADGRMIVADRMAGLQSVDLATGARSSLHPSFGVAQFRGLNDLTIAGDGGIYFTEPYGSDALNKVGRVYFVGPEEGAQPELFHEGMAYPNGIAVSADGQRVYVAEFAENRVISLPSRTTKNPFDTPFIFARMEGGIGPDGLTVDANGNLYVAHFAAGEIVVFDPLGFAYGTLRLPEGAGVWTTNLALHDGYLYVTEASQNVVWRLPVKTAALPRG
ncbi:SMP-30/gluconolactonase/LRE family protein [Salipiger abyssi]|uniref:SMP-30/gluconolactonase/LRE family protein n=1 Tax=Salipiger abyssi TaxID=1250539 RepID=UPI004058B1A8